jgi:hypothetical protein
MLRWGGLKGCGDIPVDIPRNEPAAVPTPSAGSFLCIRIICDIICIQFKGPRIMEYDPANQQFVLSDQETGILQVGEDRSSWPVAEWDGLLSAIMSARQRLADINICDYPPGAARAAVTGQKFRNGHILGHMHAVITENATLTDEDFNRLLNLS